MLPVEQPRRKRGNEGPNRRMNIHHHHHHPKPHPANAIFKDAFGGAKIGECQLVIYTKKTAEMFPSKLLRRSHTHAHYLNTDYDHLFTSNRSCQWSKCDWIIVTTVRAANHTAIIEAALNASAINRFLGLTSSALATSTTDNWEC